MILLPGLPSLPDAVNIFEDAVLFLSDALSAAFGQTGQWGIYLDGFAVVEADNVLSMGYRQDFRVSKYPQQGGAFADYNKTSEPFTTKLKFSTGGSLASRSAFIESIQDIVGDTNLYDVVTPEKTYISCNFIHQDYDRDAQTAGLVSIDVWLEEIRVAGDASFSNTKSPGGASETNNGLVQGQNTGQITRGPDLPDISGPSLFQ